jgi:hypothetical protein
MFLFLLVLPFLFFFFFFFFFDFAFQISNAGSAPGYIITPFSAYNRTQTWTDWKKIIIYFVSQFLNLDIKPTISLVISFFIFPGQGKHSLVYIYIYIYILFFIFFPNTTFNHVQGIVWGIVDFMPGKSMLVGNPK